MRHHERTILIVVTLIAGVLRAVGLNGQLWYDEITTLVNTVRVPLSTVVTTYTSNNQHTLYSILAQASVALFGEHAWSLRLPAAVLGTASVPALYLLGRSLTGKVEALAAATLLAVSYHHVWFSQNARGYTGLLFATLLSTWCLVEGIRRPAGTYSLLYAIVVALGAYLHMTMVFVAIGHALILAGIAAGRAGRRSLGRLGVMVAGVVLSGLLTLVLYSPMAADLAAFYGKEVEVIESEWNTLTWAASAAVSGLHIGYGTIPLLGAGLLAALGSIRLLKSDPIALAALVLPACLALVVMLVLRRHIWPRFFFFAFGLVLLVVVHGVSVFAAGLARLAPFDRRKTIARFVAVGVTAAMLVQSLFALPPAYACPKQDFAGALAFVDSQHTGREPVLTVGLTVFPYEQFYRTGWTEVTTESQLRQILSKGRRTWLVYTFPIHFRSRYPEVARLVDREFVSVRSFPATVGDGDVHVVVHDVHGGKT